MSEIAKTIAFVAVGGVFIGAAWIARPAAPELGVFDDSGERFFALFDPLEARSLEIVEFDEATGRPEVFKVAQVDGVWSLPSAENYPADAEDQLAAAAASIVDLTKSPHVSDSRNDHELFGVLDPMSAEAGATGVGTRITLKSASDKVLADVIVGKEVKGSEMRHVCDPRHDRVYTAAISLDKFSTSFEDWIERDLLQLNPSDLGRVVIHDYSIDEVANQLIRRDVLTLDWDTKESTWTMEGLSESQELAKDKINNLKWALDDLEIIGVHRKPAGLSAELRTMEAMQLDAQAVGSLRSRGFYISEGMLISNEGELRVGTATGVMYTLRFGEIALGYDTDEEAGEDGVGAGASRYLFVTARLDESLIPEPVIETLPDIDFASLIAEEDDEVDPEDPDAQTAEEKLEAQLEQTRKKIEEENQRRVAEHETKLAEAQGTVDQLNDRFADWYYVISDSVYQKLRLRRSDLVKDVEPEDDSG
jgi:hypothetical protein